MKHYTLNNDIIKTMNIELLDEKPRKIWTGVFVGTVVCITVVCLFIMNINYDTLARYPYKDERSRKLIKEYLDKDEIDYIIEYSIAPNMFISFITAEDFNIYHAVEYKKLSETMWMETPNHIVEMIEKTRDYIDVDTLASYLQEYSFDDIEAYLTKTDSYSENSELLTNPSASDVYLDSTHTISTRVPNNLQELNENVPSNYKILVDERIQETLQNLCNSIQSELDSNSGCGGLFVSAGYISYDSQKTLYEESDDEYYVSKPGHDEHQLGLAVDFEVDGILNENFNLTEQAEWLEKNAWQFGFVQTYTDSNTSHNFESYHYRYVGIEIARQIHDSQIDFETYSQNKK